MRDKTAFQRCGLLLLVLGWAVATAPAGAQDSEVAAPLPRGGLQIRNVSAYAVYYSNTLPTSGGFQTTTALGSDLGGGGSTQIGWAKFTQRSSFSLIYTPSYTGRVRYSSWNALNHTLGLNTSRKFAPRWSYNFSVNGDLSTLEAFLFAPTVLSSVTSVPASFDDLSAALLSSKFNNPLLASALTSAPAAQSPVRTLLYGTRMFTAGAQASFSYSYSPRLSFSFGGGGGWTQNIADNRVANTQSNYLPDTASGSANLAFSYSLSPLTQLGGGVTTARISSSLYETQTTTTTVSLGRTLARRWLVQIHGGVGVAKYLQQQQTTLPLTTKPHPAFGGSLGFKTFSNTFLGSYDRSVSDSYGLGASNSSSSGGSWHWQRPDRTWWIESAFSWEQLQGTGQNTSGWRATAGLGRAVGTRIALVMQYTYLKYSGQFQDQANNLSQSAVRVSMVWTPHPDLPR